MAYDWSAGEEMTAAKLDLTGLPYVAAGGSSNAYTADFTPDLTLTAGLRLAFKANHTNTGAATLNVDGTGATAIKKNLNQALEAGDIQNGQVVLVVYDGTNFQLVSPSRLNRRLTTFTSNVTVGNTGTETSILSVTVPGGTLGTDRAIKGRIYVQSFRNHPDGNLVIRLKYNTTEVAALTIANSVAFSSAQKGYIDFMLLSAGATNSQEGSLIWQTFVNNEINQLANDVTGAIQMVTYANEGTSAEDSTGDLTFAVSADWATAQTNNTVTFGHAIVEIIA